MGNLIERTHYTDRLLSYKNKGVIKVVTGLRRSGKSTLLELFSEQLADAGVNRRQIHFHNFELPENYLHKSWSDIYFSIKKKLLPGKTNYIFLDEIQNVIGFEKLVDGLFATAGTDIYITGSNANLLSGELATLLSGRHVEISILPFSFAEYLRARRIDTGDRYLNYERLFFDYVNETSLPKGVELRAGGFDQVFEYLEAIYTTVVEKDIMQRHRIHDKRAFGNIAKFIASNIGSHLSPGNISKSLKADHQSVHHDTVEKFADYLVESFVFYRAHRFDIKGRKQLATQEKYYLVDLGLLNILAGRERMADRGHLLENVVFLELLRRGYKVWTGAMRQGEVDFVARNKSGELEYFQVAWNVAAAETREREFKSLSQIKDNYPKCLLTTESFPQGQNGIVHQNVFAWLLELPA